MKKNMNRPVLRLAACILAVAVLTTAVGAFGAVRDTSKNADGSAAASKKDEIVYVFTDAEGNTKNVLVSDWLTNPQKEATLADCSSLENLENVKGNEGYTAGENGAVTWQADGEDIYYQGTSEQTPAVSMKIEYLLDGQKISASELAGKSGVVTIRYEYTNNETQTVEIDGKQQTVCVPFAALTGMMLDNAHFRNVTVSNGKLVNDGQRTVVVGFALPGMNAALDTELLPETVEITADVTDFSLSTTMTLVTNELFSELDLGKAEDLKTELTDALDQLTDALDQLMDGSSQLYDGLTQLLEKSDALVSGVSELKDGSQALVDSTSALQTGMTQLQDGANQLTDGLNYLDTQSKALVDGSTQLFDAVLATASSQLAAAGVEAPALTRDNYRGVLNGVSAQLDEAAVRKMATEQARAQVEAAVRANSATIRASVTAQVQAQVTASVMQQMGLDASTITPEQQAAVDAAVAQIMASAETQAQIDAAVESAIQSMIETQMQSESVQAGIEEAVQKAAAGSGMIANLLAQLDQVAAFCDGVSQYTGGVATAKAGANTLLKGTDTLSAGIDQLAGGTGRLNLGLAQLQSGVNQLVAGVSKLKDGQMELSDGLKQFKEEGIDKLSESVNGNLGMLYSRAKAMCELSKAYQSFSGLADGMSGTVRFLYRTDAIGDAE